MSDTALRLLDKLMWAILWAYGRLLVQRSRLYARAKGKALPPGSVWREGLHGMVVQVLDTYAGETTCEHLVVCLEQPPDTGVRSDDGKPFRMPCRHFVGAERIEDYWKHHADREGRFG